jgi:8-oxo-dGTP pyrophosphatase MutT (NUDIX family)
VGAAVLHHRSRRVLLYVSAMAPRIADWIDAHDSAENPLIPAATVLLIRDTNDGLETLMMRRNSKLSFAEGMWVFPGGKIDPDDHPAGAEDMELAPVAAAVREAKEEADLDIDPDSLLYYSHWVPPTQAPKRFSTWFYIAPAPDSAVTVDLGEILEHAWWSPAHALERASDKRIEILPPTWMSLHDLSSFSNVDSAMAAIAKRGPQMFATRVLKTPDGPAAAWEGDAGYLSGDHAAPGGRHRLVMNDAQWRLEQS